MESKLIASFSSLEQAEKQLCKYFHSKIILKQTSSLVWLIHNENKLIWGFQLIKKQNRYRFVLLGE